eukprot:320743_1
MEKIDTSMNAPNNYILILFIVYGILLLKIIILINNNSIGNKNNHNNVFDYNETAGDTSRFISKDTLRLEIKNTIRFIMETAIRSISDKIIDTKSPSDKRNTIETAENNLILLQYYQLVMVEIYKYSSNIFGYIAIAISSGISSGPILTRPIWYISLGEISNKLSTNQIEIVYLSKSISRPRDISRLILKPKHILQVILQVISKATTGIIARLIFGHISEDISGIILGYISRDISRLISEYIPGNISRFILAPDSIFT